MTWSASYTSKPILGRIRDVAYLDAVAQCRAKRRCPQRRRWLARGVAAGVVIFLVMNYLVVPLSAAPFRPRFTLHGFAAAFKADKFIENLLVGEEAADS